MIAARRASSTKRRRAITCSASARTRPWITSPPRAICWRKRKTSPAIPASTKTTPGPGLRWRDFVGAMKVLAPKVTVDKVLFPKLFAGEYGAEVSTLLTSKSQALHTSFYDGDLESFVYQEQARGLDKRMTIIMTTGETAIWRLRDKMPDGTIIGAPGRMGGSRATPRSIAGSRKSIPTATIFHRPIPRTKWRSRCLV